MASSIKKTQDLPACSAGPQPCYYMAPCKNLVSKKSKHLSIPFWLHHEHCNKPPTPPLTKTVKHSRCRGWRYCPPGSSGDPPHAHLSMITLHHKIQDHKFYHITEV